MGANWSESRSDFSSAEDEDVSNDEDWIKSPDDLTESFDSGVSLKSDQSKAGMILFEDSPPLSRSVFSSFEEVVVSDDEDLVESPDDLMAKGSRLSIESFDSGVSFKSDQSKAGLIHFKDRVSPSRLDLSSFEKKRDVSDDGFLESPDDLMAMGSLESNDSGVSLKSDRSKAGWIDFKDRVSPRPDFSSSEEEDVSDDEDLVESPDDQRAVRRTLYEPAKSDIHIALRQQSPLMMAHRSVEAFGSGLTLMNDSFIRPQQRSLPRMVLKSMEACGSGLSLMNDSFIRTGQHSPPREEMNQELLFEVGWKHG